MARDVSDDAYYITSGGKIPVKWTAPEVWILCEQTMNYTVGCLTHIGYTV